MLMFSCVCGIFACTLHVPSDPEDQRPSAEGYVQLESNVCDGEDGKGANDGGGNENGGGGNGGNSNASSKNKDACLKLRRCSLS